MALKLIDLEKRRKEEVVAEIRCLLAAAEQGRISGLLYVYDGPSLGPRIGAAGEYRRNPKKALQATFMMEASICGKEFSSSR